MFDLLDAMDSVKRHMDWHLISGRVYRRRDMEKAVALGLAESGQCVVCDGDGFALDPERYREGWTLTALGQKWLEVAKANRREDGYPSIPDDQIMTAARLCMGET